MNWDKKELAYQHVHMFYGFWLSYLMYCITGLYQSFWIGCIAGIIAEVVQYYFLSNRNLYLFDRLRDWMFWSIGGSLILFVI